MSAPRVTYPGTTGGGVPVGGSGTINYLSKWVGPTTLGDSALVDDGTSIYTTTRLFGAGTSTPTALVDAAGSSAVRASLRIRSGTAPAAPNDGDLWYDGTYLYLRASGINQPLNAPYGTGTTNVLTKWSGTSGLVDSSVTDNGTTVAIGSAYNVTSASGVTRIGTNLAGRFPNTQVAITSILGGANETNVIGLFAEALSNGATQGVGLYGHGQASGTFAGIGVTGEGHVTASADAGNAVGVRGYATDTHAGGANIGARLQAAGGTTNWALEMVDGNIKSDVAQTWQLAAGTSALNVSSGLLNLDTTNARVGVGQTLPISKLHVSGGDIRFDNTYGIIGNANTAGWTLRGDGTRFVPAQLQYSDLGGTPTIPTVSGTVNYVAKFTAANAVGNSSITDNGTTIALGSVLQVTSASGNLSSTGGSIAWALAAGTSALNVSSGLLNLDTTNARVGVGQTLPLSKLHVSGGDIRFDNTYGIIGNANTAGWTLRGDGTRFVPAQLQYSDLGGTPTIPTVSGTVNYVAKFTAANAVGNSSITDNGTTIQLGTSTYVSATSAQVGIGTSSYTSGRALTTIADLDVYGIRAGRGPGASIYNTVFGQDSFLLNTTGTENTAVGYRALRVNADGAVNTAIGATTLAACTSGSYNTAVGRFGLASTTTGNYNTSVGTNSLTANQTGSFLTAVGYGSAYNTKAGANTVVGGEAFYDNVSGTENAAFGYWALRYSTGSGNTAVGQNAGYNQVGGTYNIFLGWYATASGVTDTNEIVIGTNIAGQGSNTATLGNTSTVTTFLRGSQVAISTTSPTANRALTTIADLDVYGLRVGRGAGAIATNTAVGASALNAVTTGNDNTAIGNGAGPALTDGYSNTLVGSKAGNAMQRNYYCTAIGFESLRLANDVNGRYNTGVGAQTLWSMTTGALNTAIGAASAAFGTTLQGSVSVGFASAIYSNGNYNTAVGYDSMRGTAVYAGAQNTAVGYSSLYKIDSGSQNAAFGDRAFEQLTSGSGNVGVGALAGAVTTTGSYNICVGYNAQPAAASDSDEIVIGRSATGAGSNTVTIGNANNVATFLDTKYVRLVDSYTVATLPTPGTAGRICWVTDADAGLAWSQVVSGAGGGTKKYLLWDNGTNWTVVGA